MAGNWLTGSSTAGQRRTCTATTSGKTPECPSSLQGHPSSLLVLGDALQAGLASGMGVQAVSVSL